MKKVLILYGKSDWRKKRPFEKKMYQFAYEYFYQLAEKNGLKIYRASYQWYDHKKKIFKHAWIFENKRWQRTHNVSPDLIHDKTRSRMELFHFIENLSANYKIINDPEFKLLADNKLFSSLLLPKYFKKYFKLHNPKELAIVANSIKGSKIVLKPLTGSGGESVLILDKKDLFKNKLAFPLIAQEFIDSSNGIKNIVKGVHDLRLVFINNDLIYSYVRQPAKGSLLANLAQGGSMFIVEKSQLPKNVFPIIKEVQDVFGFYAPKIYTVDFIFDKKQQPWIVELNTMPGMYFSDDQKKWMDKMYLALIKTFKQALE